jgi:hypothetical protein
MASHGVYISACGFYHHGPKGVIGFAPKIDADDFKCAWIGAEGWGSYSQQTDDGYEAELQVKHGSLNLKEMLIPSVQPGRRPLAQVNGRLIKSEAYVQGAEPVRLIFDQELTLAAGDKLTVAT